MAQYAFKQIDVFTERAFLGNPVAVVLGADDLDAARMQRIAAWTNLSETVFLLQPSTAEADYRARIFTPAHELPFAGHPTIGAAHAALEGGALPAAAVDFKQECGAGVLSLRVERDDRQRRIFVRAPEATFARAFGDLTETLSGCLGAQIAREPAPAAFDNGPVWLFVRLATADAVAGLAPDMSALAGLSREHGISGVAAFALLEEDGPRVHIRCFAPAFGVFEDPVTGSANAALPAALARAGLLDRVGREYVVTQGSELGRDGRVYVRVLDDEGRAEIGGHAVTVVDGRISF